MTQFTKKTPEDKKAVTKTYLKTTVEVVGLYLPAIGVGLLGGALSIHNLLNKENAPLLRHILPLILLIVSIVAVSLISGVQKQRNKSDLIPLTIFSKRQLSTRMARKKKIKKTIQVTNVDEASEYARYYVKCNFLNSSNGGISLGSRHGLQRILYSDAGVHR